MKAAMGIAVRNIHEDWIPCLELAAREVFELMLGCQLTTPEVAAEKAHKVTAMVGLAGQLCGVMTIRCSREAAGLMASKMLGVTPADVGAALCDAMGEICNMVAENVKNKISGMSAKCMLSTPSVIIGTDYKLHSVADSPALVIRLLFEGMPIVISLHFHS
jgi:CheY-specific phosphatase CheX